MASHVAICDSPIGPRDAAVATGAAPEPAPPAMDSSARPRSCAEWNRSAGSFSRHRATIRPSAGEACSVARRELRRIRLQNRVHRLDRRRAGERAFGGQHLVEHRAEREDVGARVGLLPADLLGRHVAERAHHDAGLGQRLRPRDVRVLVDRLLGETEVENLDASVGRDEQVGWLDVAVRDALFVRRREAGGDLPAEVDRLGRGQRPGREPRRERLAFQELGDEVRRAVVRAEIEDREDVRMIERARRVRLAHEALQPVGVSGEGRGQHFDRDVTIEARVPGPVDLAHAPVAERRDDLVGAEPGAGTDRHQGQIVACVRRLPDDLDERDALTRQRERHGDAAVDDARRSRRRQ